MELPPAPWYRRWSFLLAGVIGLAAITALLGWRGLQQVSGAPTTTLPPTTVTTAPTTTTEPTIGPTSKPDEVLWEKVGSEVATSREFRAPSTWRIEWSFDCSNFADLGGGNFKITGNGAFSRIQIQAFGTRASGTKTFTAGGFGRLQVDSVCERWSVRALSG